MTKKKYFRFILMVLPVVMVLFLFSCSQTRNGIAVGDEWLIPEGEVQDGGPGKDGIPALTNPPFVTVAQVDYLTPQDLVIGVRIGNDTKAYPHLILDSHEIVNDSIGDTGFVLSYCPLTGSGMVWNLIADAQDKTFGVSGLLYNSNLILYDRDTDSLWSQMLMLCVNGPKIRTVPQMIHVIETTWATWQLLFPNSQVLSIDTGFFGSYTYPYGNYKTSDSLLFPVSNEDNRLHKKERVHGVYITSDITKTYPIRNFTAALEVVNDTVGGVDIVTVGSNSLNLAVSFERTLDGTVLTFAPVQNELPVVLEDNEGTKWDVFGRGISGPRAGSQLTPTLSYNAYWFAWAAFFPGADIWQ